MSISSDSAEQTIRLTLEGIEVVAKISGAAAKNIAVALYTISQDQKKVSKGKTRLTNMLKSDNELKIFSIKKEDLKTFCHEAKRYGVNIIGREIVGLCPMEALIDVASYYLGLENFTLDKVLEISLME